MTVPPAMTMSNSVTDRLLARHEVADRLIREDEQPMVIEEGPDFFRLLQAQLLVEIDTEDLGSEVGD
jgi:hypothetical protein